MSYVHIQVHLPVMNVVANRGYYAHLYDVDINTVCISNNIHSYDVTKKVNKIISCYKSELL